MPASRAPKQPDAVRPHAELLRTRPHDSNCPQNVAQRSRMPILHHAVLQHEHCDAKAVESSRVAAAAVTDGQAPVPSARTVNHRCPIGLGRVRA